MIKKLLVSIYHYLFSKKRNIRYWLDTRKYLTMPIGGFIQIPELPKGKYLVLIPHSDDEWIGNSTLISNPQYDVALFDMDMPGNDDENKHICRFQEMQSVANRYCRTLYSKKNNDSLSYIIAEYNPEFVTVPYFFDWHMEHKQVMEELYNICRETRDLKVAMYQVTVPIAPYNITHANSMNRKVWKNKWRLFHKYYATQMVFPSYRVGCQERINGRYLGFYSCEVFSVMSGSEWTLFVEKSLPHPETMKIIKQKMGSIPQIREYKQPSICSK